MIQKNKQEMMRHDDWPDWADVALLAKLTFTEHAETRIGANIRLVKLHQRHMHDADAIARAERTVAQLERQLLAQEKRDGLDLLRALA